MGRTLNYVPTQRVGLASRLQAPHKKNVFTRENDWQRAAQNKTASQNGLVKRNKQGSRNWRYWKVKRVRSPLSLVGKTRHRVC